MKVIVLAAGTSTERDVSIVSGTEVAKALKARGHEVFLLDVFFGCSDEEAAEAFVKPQDIEAAAAVMRADSAVVDVEKLKRKAFFGPNVINLCSKADKVFMALHGSNGEDGRVQAAFDLYGISYTGTGYLSSALAMDKNMTKKLFRLNGVSTPKGGTLYKNSPDKSLKYLQLHLPVIVKPCCGGSSVGTNIAYTDEEYQEALDAAFYYEDTVIVERYIVGREFSVAVVDGRAYPVIEIAPKEGFYDYENKYKAGATVETCPAELSVEKNAAMQRMAENGAEALGITGYCRLDFMMDERGEIYCLEANTLPGMTPTSLLPQEAAAMGIDFGMLCEKLLNI